MTFTPTDPTKAEVRITGTAPNQSLDFYIPRGAKGEPGGFNTGTDLTGTDLNTVTVPGLYRQSNGNNVTTLNNYPLNAGAGVLEVESSNTPGDVMQRYTPIAGAPTGSGRAFYIRRYFGGVWGAWYTYTAARVDQTAGRAIYHWDDLNGRDQLVWGDTGIRRVEADFKNGWTAAIASIRRVGSTVSFGTYTVNPTARTADIAYTVPSGFRPAGYGGNVAFPVRYSGASNTDWMQVTGLGDVYPPLAAISSNGFICVSTWTTMDAWPTSLPGTASGGIASN